MKRATIHRERLDCSLTALEALPVLRGKERPFALLGTWGGGGAILGSRPVRVVAPGADPFAALDEQPELDCPAAVGPDFVGGGWFGFLGFRLGGLTEALDPPPPARVALPDAALAYYDHVLRLDRDGTWWFEALVTPEREAALRERRAELALRLASAPAARPFATGGWRWSPEPGAHARLVDACRERIRCGDLFQANLAMRLDGRLTGDPLDLFAAAATALPTDRAAFVEGPWGTLASLSPELFLERRGRGVRTAPIKGTRPLDRRDELVASGKDRAENVMIVDLMRNDLGRVCVPGTVRVPVLADVRPHAGVWHMVSEVEGRLRDGVGDAELLRATFPPGSVTGAPKVAALNVIAELESTRREAYTGAIGFASPARGLELSVAIRTFEVRGSRVWLGAGGGIVADSDAAAEASEAATKAAPLLAAVGATLPEALLAEPRVPRMVRRGPRPAARPHPDAGLYETVRIERGVAVRWPAHLARLAASARVLYGLRLPEDLGALVAERARAAGEGRLRIDLVPGEEPRLEVTPLPPAAPALLRPVVLPGGLGEHKWRDRSLLEAHEADDPATLPLLVDADGCVLESSRTGIVARAPDGTLHAPLQDGRILPSVTVAASGAARRRLTLGDLEAASEIYVASALRGLQRATLSVPAR